MSVKELIVDSWYNMLKNKFILKTILVCLAYCLVCFAGCIVLGIAETINDFLGFLVYIAFIIVLIPIALSTTKVLLDVFQGRDTSVFGFVKYGFKNIKRIWAIIGRLILKFLVLYIIKIALVIALVIYIASSLVVVVQKYTDQANVSSSSISEDSLVSSLDSLDKTFENYDPENLSTDELEKDIEGWSENLLSRGVSNEFIEDLAELFVQYLVIILVFWLAQLILDIMIYIKALYYNYPFVLAFENDSLTSREAVENSKTLMTGNRWKYFLTSLVITIIAIVVFVLLIIVLANTKSGLLAILGLLLIIACSILLIIYNTSYYFTFYNKLVGVTNSTETAPVVEEVAPVVENAPVAEDVPTPEVEGNPLSKEAESLDESLSGSEDEDLTDKE